MGSRTWLFVGLLGLACLPGWATLTVTTTADVIADDGQCTLREAIGTINGGSSDCGTGGAPIHFNIPGAGVHTIQIATPLPAVANTMTIDGFTQPGAVANSAAFPAYNGVLRIVLQPAPGSTAVDGLRISPGGVNAAITGLVINGFSGAGIRVEADGVSVRNNFIGTNAAGTAAIPNTRGLDLISPSNARFERNYISGNTSHGISIAAGNAISILRNVIGLAVDGTSPLGNGGDGIRVTDVPDDGANDIRIAPQGTGVANKIGYSGGAGIGVTGFAFGVGGTDNIFVGNGGLDVDLGVDGPTANDTCDADNGPNGFQNKPVSLTISSNGTNFTEVFGQVEVGRFTLLTLLIYTDNGGVRQLAMQSVIQSQADCTVTFSFTRNMAFTPGSQVMAALLSGNGISEFNAFTVLPIVPPAITAVDPARGTHLGGTLITVSGGPFEPTAQLRIDGMIPASSTVVNSTTIRARMPAHAPGPVDVTVLSSRGTATAPGAYTYVLQKQKNDVGADGYSDLVFRNYSDGRNRMYIGETNTIVNLPAVTPTTMQISGMGDFDNDDRSDIVWRDVNSGVNATWLLDTHSVAGVPRQPFVKAGYFLPNLPGAHLSIAAVGDVDGDRDADLIWRNANDGTIAVWLLQNGQYAAGHVVDVAPIGMRVRGAGDVDGDGKADILFRNLGTGENAVWLMNGPVIAQGHLLPEVDDSAMQMVSIADMNNDGKADIVWRNAITGVNALWLMNGAAVAQGRFLPPFTQSSDLCTAADFSNDTRPDLYFRSPSGNNGIIHDAMTGDGTPTAAPFVDGGFTCLAQ